MGSLCMLWGAHFRRQTAIPLQILHIDILPHWQEHLSFKDFPIQAEHVSSVRRGIIQEQNKSDYRVIAETIATGWMSRMRGTYDCRPSLCAWPLPPPDNICWWIRSKAGEAGFILPKEPSYANDEVRRMIQPSQDPDCKRDIISIGNTIYQQPGQ